MLRCSHSLNPRTGLVLLCVYGARFSHVFMSHSQPKTGSQGRCSCRCASAARPLTWWLPCHSQAWFQSSAVDSMPWRHDRFCPIGSSPSSRVDECRGRGGRVFNVNITIGYRPSVLIDYTSPLSSVSRTSMEPCATWSNLNCKGLACPTHSCWLGEQLWPFHKTKCASIRASVGTQPSFLRARLGVLQ